MRRIDAIDRILVILCLALVAAPVAWAQQVARHPDPTAPLAQRWTWAEQEARRLGDGGAWIAYGIRRRMGEHSTIRHGTYHSDWSGRTSLYETIYGEAPPGTLPAATPREEVRRAARQALDRRDRAAERKVDKDVAFLFRLDGGGRLEAVEFSNLTEPFDLGLRPLVWLGPAGDAESVAFLEAAYARAGRDALREDLVAAVGIHDEAARVVPFLKEVLASRADDDLREQAAFWLGQTDDPEALRVLTATVRDDPSRKVREHAVFALSQMELEAATDELIRLARRGDDRGVRKQAIFWLGQKASEKAVAALQDAVFDEDDTEVQKQAVFALSQLPAERGIPMLIDVAKTHRNPEVRKQALFWLGQSGDPRAVDLLVEIVKGR